jgi:hypothetical protein
MGKFLSILVVHLKSTTTIFNHEIYNPNKNVTGILSRKYKMQNFLYVFFLNNKPVKKKTQKQIYKTKGYDFCWQLQDWRIYCYDFP